MINEQAAHRWHGGVSKIDLGNGMTVTIQTKSVGERFKAFFSGKEKPAYETVTITDTQGRVAGTTEFKLSAFGMKRRTKELKRKLATILKEVNNPIMVDAYGLERPNSVHNSSISNILAELDHNGMPDLTPSRDYSVPASEETPMTDNGHYQESHLQDPDNITGKNVNDDDILPRAEIGQDASKNTSAPEYFPELNSQSTKTPPHGNPYEFDIPYIPF